MNHVELNHVSTISGIQLLATSLLIAGSVLSGVLFLYGHYLSNETALLQAKLQQPKTSQQPFRRFSSLSIAKEEVAKKDDEIAVKAAIQEILLPWPALFKSLEALNSPDVKLLMLEPNAKQRTLHITAVALDAGGMVRYLDELAHQRVLQQVILQSQESADVNGQKVIRFVIGATWNL